MSHHVHAKIQRWGNGPGLRVAGLMRVKAAGVPIPDGLKADADARLQRLLGKNGEEYWLTLHNFYVITRYNFSHMYAMAVYQLSEKIALA